MLKRKSDKNSDEASTSEKSGQVRVFKEADEDSCDVFTTELGKGKYSDVWLLDLGCTYHMCSKREWFNTYKPYNGGSIMMGPYARL